MQKAAIEEQEQLAEENPIAAAVTAASNSTSGGVTSQGNTENLLDIDFDGSAPASLQKAPTRGSSGLEGLGGTPQRMESPAAGVSAQPSNGMDDLMGLFGNGAVPATNSSGGMDDLMNGFGGLGVNQPPATNAPKSNDDILGLF